MDKELFSLAVQGVRRKRRSSGLVVLVLLVSFGFALMSLSVLGSIQATNASYRQNLYGSWYYALPNGQPQDAEFLSRWAGAKRWGQMQCYGTTRGGVSIGTIDEGLRELGRLELASGAWPSALREVAIEEDVLAEMGLEAVPGQKIDLDIVIRCGGETLVIQRSYTLTGVIRPFTDRWMWSENAVWPLVGAVVTPEEAQVVQEKMAGHAQSRGLVVDPPGFSYFIQPRHDPETEPGPLKNDCNALREYLMETRSGVDTVPMENKAILAPEGGNISPRLYLTMILAVAGVSVLCVYLMQLPGDVHSFVTLRSLGMTRGQLWQLCLTETGLLLLPALVLGVPLGAGLTWVGLRLLAYTDSVPVKVALPWGQLGLLVVLWLAVTALARTLLFWVAVRTPLTGGFQLRQGAARRVRWLRNGLIGVLLCVFGMVTVMPLLESQTPLLVRENLTNQSHYTVMKQSDMDPKTRIGSGVLITPQQLEELSRIPGIASVRARLQKDVGLSFARMPRRTASLLVVGGQWDFLQLGEDAAAFEAGDLALLCFPDESVNDGRLTDDWAQYKGYGSVYLQPGEDISSRDYTLPQGPITVHFYNKEKTDLASLELPAAVRRIPQEANGNGGHIHDPYTVVLSPAGLQKALDAMPADAVWDAPDGGGVGNAFYFGYRADAPAGFEVINLWADMRGNLQLTDRMVSDVSKEHKLGFLNNRARISVEDQEQIQVIVLLYAVSGCVAVTALLILAGAMSLDTVEAHKKFARLRAIGMSRLQMTGRVLGKAAARAFTALAGGGVLYLLYAGQKRVHAYANPTLPTELPQQISLVEAIQGLVGYWGSRGIGLNDMVGPMLLAFGGAALVALAAKAKLWKGRETL